MVARSTRWLALVVAVASTLSPAARADEAARGPAAEQLVARVELQRRFGLRLDVRWDPDTGCPRSIRFEPPVAVPDGAPAEAAARLLEALEPLYGRLVLQGQDARPGARLVPTDVAPAGPFRVVRFRQELEGLPLEDAVLSVTLARRDGRTVATRVSGQVWGDAPRALPTPPAPRADATLVVTPRSGAWGYAWVREVVEEGLPVRRVEGLDGRLLARVVLAQHGRAVGTVHPEVGPAAEERPLPDLLVDAGGRVVVTDAEGSFPGDAGVLPWGLRGRWERVVPVEARADYPVAEGGRLDLSSPDQSHRRSEVNLYYHLAQTRRYYAELPGLPRGAWDKSVAAFLREDVYNAFASSKSATVDGQTYDYHLMFGFRMALDASVVSHERNHALLYGLGFTGDAGRLGDYSELHEAYADYLTACRLDSPAIGAADSFGYFRRNIAVDRTYPEHASLEPHEASVILSGALWDARQEVGAAGARAVGAAAVAAVPEFDGSTTLPEAAQAILDKAPAEVTEAVRRHFVRHGLIADGPQPAPVVRVEEMASQTVRLTLRPGETRRLSVVAWAPEDLTGARGVVEHPTPVLVTTSRPRFVGTAGEATQWVRRDGRAVEVPVLDLELAPEAADVGHHELVVVAQNERTARAAVHRVTIAVLPVGGPATAAYSHEVAAPVGSVTRVGLHELFPPIAAAEVGSYRFMTSGRTSAGAALLGGELVVAPEPGEEGTHRFTVHAAPADRPRHPEEQLACEVTVVVGALPAEVVVTEPYRRPVHRLLPPGGAATVEAGSQVALWAGARLSDPSGSRLGLDWELVDAPDWATLSQYATAIPPLHGSSSNLRAMAGRDLRLAPPADLGPGAHELTLVLRRDATELARRVVRVVVVPGVPAEEPQEEGPVAQLPPAPPADAPPPAEAPDPDRPTPPGPRGPQPPAPGGLQGIADVIDSISERNR